MHTKQWPLIYYHNIYFVEKQKRESKSFLTVNCSIKTEFIAVFMFLVCSLFCVPCSQNKEHMGTRNTSKMSGNKEHIKEIKSVYSALPGLFICCNGTICLIYQLQFIRKNKKNTSKNVC